MNRRHILIGLGAALAAPAIIRTPGLLMPVRRIDLSRTWYAAPRAFGLADGSNWKNSTTIWDAGAQARPGDRVYLASGFYHGVGKPLMLDRTYFVRSSNGWA